MNLQLHLLNPQQREAVKHIAGPLLILAGAGSGKTRVITHRIGYLLDQGIAPGHILAVSFTNKAAQEMKERVAHLVGTKLASKVHLSTFHSLGADILRRDIDALGYKKPFTILDQGDQLDVVKEAMKELKLDPKIVDPRRIIALISRAKMALKDPAELEDFRFDPLMPFAQRIFSYYNSALRGLNAVDFDDLICLPCELFQNHENIRLKYANTYQFVMIDEYQDTNETQLMFLREIVKDHNNICVVGDDDQSIYGFRGAVAENILKFEHNFNGTKVIKLEQNYRSTNSILTAANVLIANNKVRKSKSLWSAKGDGQKLRRVFCRNEREEAEFVGAEIERYKSAHHLDYRDFAILYRVNPQAQVFEEALRAFRIPYTVVGSTEFFDRKEVKDFIAYLKVSMNLDDEINLRRIVNVPPRGIGPTMLERFSDFAKAEKLSFFNALRRICEFPERVPGVGNTMHAHLLKFVDTIEEFHTRFKVAEQNHHPLAEVARAYLKRIHLVDHILNIEKNPKTARRRVQNVEDILANIASFQDAGNNSLDVYLGRITIDQSSSNDNDAEKDKGVKMMTFHSSKGLEFPVVFLVGMEEGFLPHQRSIHEQGGIAEERRLAYVGITRAQSILIMTTALERTKYGKKESREPSRFFEELPPNMVITETAEGSESLIQKKEEQNARYMQALRSAIFD